MTVEYEKKKSKKAIIVNAALSEFAVNGYDKTSVRDIAKAAGVTTGALYYYYKDKEALVVDVIDQVLSVCDVPFTDKSSLPEGSIADIIVDYVAENFSNMAGQRQRILALNSILTMKSSSSIRQLAMDKYNKIIKRIGSNLAYAFDKNESDCKLLAAFLIAALDGITLQFSLNVDIGSKEQLQEYYKKFYKKSINEFLK